MLLLAGQKDPAAGGVFLLIWGLVVIFVGEPLPRKEELPGFTPSS
ncbi:hypothetical protein [Streptomyces sp. NPDC006510]